MPRNSDLSRGRTSDSIDPAAVIMERAAGVAKARRRSALAVSVWAPGDGVALEIRPVNGVA